MRAPPPGWVAHLVATHPGLAPVVRAFGPVATAPPCSQIALTQWAAAARPTLGAAIRAGLTGEVDTDQASLFARRVAAVDDLLARGDQPVLRTALVARAAELLVAPRPRALRIRALADFYYSQAARLHHQQATPARSIPDVVATARWTEEGSGLSHARLTGPGPAGPIHINLLRADGVRVRCVHLSGPPRTLPEVVTEAGALAGVSGGFFLYSEPDIPPPLHRKDPVGVLVSDGRVAAGPGLRRATLWTDASGLHIARTGPIGWTLKVGDRSWRITACNDPTAGGPTWFNRAFGRRAPQQGLQVRGTLARGLGDEIDLLGGVLVDSGATDIHGPISWRPPDSWQQAMAGGPMLVGPGPTLDLVYEDFAADAPPITFSRDETYDQNLLPRMAAGLDRAGRLVFAAIDGRNFAQAPGFTLRMTADLMQALDCTHAMNLDGGSSKRMAVGGRCVDLASTEVVAGPGGPVRRRTVVSAILLGG